MLSNAKIDKIGEKIRDNLSLIPREAELLLDWRNSFVDILDYYHKRSLQKIDENKIVVIGKRLKRIPSIHKKLRRSKTLRLSTMQDIAGLRIVLKTQSDLQAAVSTMRGSQSKNILKKMYDYHSNPKEDGYRSVHLIYQSQKLGKLIELQFRTEIEHIWATAVEVYGAIQYTSFKTGEGDSDWKEFFKFLSSFFAMEENSSVLAEHKKMSRAAIISSLKKRIKKLKVIERLAAATNGVKTVVSRHSKGRWGKYAIIELDLKMGTTKVDIYNNKDITEAIRIYTQKELEIMNDPNKNVVFANIESLESLQEAYPNYFLDTEKLIQILGKIALGEF